MDGGIVAIFCLKAVYVRGLAKLGHIWGYENLFLNCFLNFRFFEEQFDDGRVEDWKGGVDHGRLTMDTCKMQVCEC
jgi:hypothetical protein